MLIFFGVSLLLLRHLQGSLFLLAPLTINNDNSRQPSVSQILFQEVLYYTLPDTPFPSLAYAVITPFFKYNVRSLLQRQNTFDQSLGRVPEAKDVNFYLSAEKADTQKSVEVLRDVIDDQLNATPKAVCLNILQLSLKGDFKSFQRQYRLILEKIFN